MWIQCVQKPFVLPYIFFGGGIGIVWTHCNKWGDQEVVQREKYITEVDMIFFPLLFSHKCFYIRFKKLILFLKKSLGLVMKQFC